MEELSEWLFDSVQQFLSSPLWFNPIQTFIDENCMVFENEEENQFVYTLLHQQFKDVIDNVLETHLVDMGVTPEQFVQCLEKVDNATTRVVFQHILAMDDFLTFKKMMLKRNLELEAEAIRDIQNANVSNDEIDDDLAEAIRLSTLENGDYETKIRELEEAELQAAIAMSLNFQEQHQSDENQRLTSQESDAHMRRLLEESEKEQRELNDNVEKEKIKQQEQLQKVLEERLKAKESIKELNSNDELRSREIEKLKQLQNRPKGELPPLRGSVQPQQQQTLQPVTAQTSENQSSQSPQESMKDRLAAMKRQKELLIQKKKEEREKEMERYKEKTPTAKSAPPIESTFDKPLTEDDKKRQEMSNALARKLKEELLNSGVSKNDHILATTERMMSFASTRNESK